MRLPDSRREERPTATVGALSENITAAGSSCPESTEIAARARRHGFAVRVVSERRDGVLVTQYMTDLPSAERKRARTLARGLRCELHLVRILPVTVTPLPAVATVEHLAELLGVGV